MDEQSIRDNERVQCRREIEAFAVAYVEKWERIQSRSKDAIKAQGWAILQAAVSLTRPKTTQSDAAEKP